MNRQILKDIYWSDELIESLNNISHDDKCSIQDYSNQELVAEARYVLSCFYEGGHNNNAALNGEHDEPNFNRAWALKEVKALKKFIKKYETI